MRYYPLSERDKRENYDDLDMKPCAIYPIQVNRLEEAVLALKQVSSLDNGLPPFCYLLNILSERISEVLSQIGDQEVDGELEFLEQLRKERKEQDQKAEKAD